MHFEDKDYRSKIGKYVPSAVFILFIYITALVFIFSPKADYSSSEKRYLSQFPEVSAENVLNGTFGEDFETYFADQFPQRNQWVGINSYFQLAIGNNGANGVYKCSDGRLINKPVSQQNSFDRNIDIITEFSDSIDIPVTAMIVPSTGYIADDVLPAYHEKYIDDELFDSAAAKLTNSGVNFIDLREAFKGEYKSGTQLYYKTDHHWTTAGAYTAYTQLCSGLKIQPIDKSSFEVKSYDGFYGTTYSTSGLWLTAPDKIEVWENPKNTNKSIKVKITEADETKEADSMYFYDHLEEDDKYPVFIDGNHALTEITNTNAEGGTVVLIKDSFSHCLAPFLADNYSKVILVDMRYYKLSVSDIIKQNNAEQVIFLYGIDNIATDTDIGWLS